jgi:hypothetical protein
MVGYICYFPMIIANMEAIIWDYKYAIINMEL